MHPTRDFRGNSGHLGVPESRRAKRARPPGAEMMSEDAKFASGFGSACLVSTASTIET
jgi:hypothetical protein